MPELVDWIGLSGGMAWFVGKADSDSAAAELDMATPHALSAPNEDHETTAKKSPPRL